MFRFLNNQKTLLIVFGTAIGIVFALPILFGAGEEVRAQGVADGVCYPNTLDPDCPNNGLSAGTSAAALSTADNPVGGGDSQKTTPVTIKCGVGWDHIGGCVVWLVDIVIYQSSSIFFFYAGVLVDTFMAISLSSTFTKQIEFVDFGWVITRDIANTAFIFVLLYIAIATILQLGGGNTKRMLVSLIIAALLVNFSLFLTRLVIDATNIVAIEFYNKIGTGDDPPVNISGIQTRSISNGFLIVNNQAIEPVAAGYSNSGQTGRAIVLLLLGALLNIGSFFIFLSVAFLFLGRVIALWFVMIFAPIAFVAAVIPFASGVWNMWKQTLTKQAIFAPIVLFFFYLAYAFLKNVPTFKDLAKPNADAWTNPSAADGSAELLNAFINVGIPPIIVYAFLAFGLSIARDMSGAFGAQAEKWGKLGLGAALGGVAIVSRRTIGAGAEKLRETQLYQRMQAQSGLIGKSFTKSLDKMATSSFDVRATRLSQVPEAGGFGAAKAGGYVKIQQEERDRQKKEFETIKDAALQAKYLGRMDKGDARTLLGTLSFEKQQEIIKHASPEQKKAWRMGAGAIGGAIGAVVGLGTSPLGGMRRKSEYDFLSGLAGEKKVREDKRKEALKKEFEGLTRDEQKADFFAKQSQANQSILVKAYPGDIEAIAKSVEVSSPENAKILRGAAAGLPIVPASATLEEKKETYQKAYRAVTASVDEKTNKVIRTVTENKAAYITTLDDMSTLGNLWADESDTMRAELKSLGEERSAKGDTALKKKLDLLEARLTPSQQFATRRAFVEVANRKEADKRKDAIRKTIQTIKAKGASPAYASIIGDNLSKLTPKQISTFEPDVLKHAAVRSRIDAGTLKEIVAFGELSAVDIQYLASRLVDRLIAKGTAAPAKGSAEKAEFRKIRSSDVIMKLLDPAREAQVTHAAQ